MMVEQLLKNHSIISDQVSRKELRVLLREFEKVLEQGIEGDVVELGCYAGTTSLFLQRMIVNSKQRRQLHVYDSFAGLPPKHLNDASVAGDQFTTGALFATKSQFILNFKKAGLRLPIIYKGWFTDITADKLPSSIAFAFLDGDYYESIRDSLRLVWPRLSEGAALVVDDYQNEALPGAQRAVDEWLAAHPATLRVQESLAIIKAP